MDAQAQLTMLETVGGVELYIATCLERLQNSSLHLSTEGQDFGAKAQVPRAEGQDFRANPRDLRAEGQDFES